MNETLTGQYRQLVAGGAIASVLIVAIGASACSPSEPLASADSKKKPGAGGAYEITYCEGTSGSGITAGPDGNIWTTAEGGVARVAPDCTGFEKFANPEGTGVLTYHVAAGPDGNVWFADMYGGKIGRATPSGEMTMFPVKIHGQFLPAVYDPYELVAGNDGNMWFTVQALSSYLSTAAPGYVGSFSPNDPEGTMRLWEVSGNPMGIALGPDGMVWFMQTPRYSDGKGGGIGRITYDGAITHYPFPADKPNGPVDSALTTSELTAGPDGNIWFVEEWPSDIGRFSPETGHFTWFEVPAAQWPDEFASSGGATAHISHITPARDGNLYAIEHNAKAQYLFYQITTEGEITGLGQSRDPSGSTGGLYMVNGPDGNLWFTEQGTIGRMTIPKKRDR